MKRPVTVVVLLALALGGTAWRLADTKPDPNTQAIADGCQRDTTKIYTGAAPNWVYVNDRDFPSAGPPPGPRWVSGTVKGPLGLLASRVASSDDPITHHSYDVNLDVTVQRADDFLTGTSRDTTPEQGTLHLERESSSYPEWARPQAGDHVEALGSWIWDCDHYQGRGEKTEFHPFRAVWVGAARLVAPLAARRRRRRPLHLERPDARRQAGRVLAPGQGQRPVQVVLALRTRLVERQRDVSLRALRARPAPAGRPPRDRARRQGQQPGPAAGGDGAQGRAAPTSSSRSSSRTASASSPRGRSSSAGRSRR